MVDAGEYGDLQHAPGNHVHAASQLGCGTARLTSRQRGNITPCHSGGDPAKAETRTWRGDGKPLTDEGLNPRRNGCRVPFRLFRYADA